MSGAPGKALTGALRAAWEHEVTERRNGSRALRSVTGTGYVSLKELRDPILGSFFEESYCYGSRLGAVRP